ncbi:hypothetical protein SAICODRAFT_166084 [Saitoella complicata NRRL Y-17804]|uniref:uncharacterized protein n=1 Tax=Saitoella complicata (strain BCRC 22490 / CBS 7301 / JCM 7358 / NBRC 10748 / NRRL Y-17804) TaxID=698492 RepID=UPI00086739A7|nr:uncharacterized protein SAICODRAFT_166084 [Saitoella complicata NRRL Y-17804]ODQ50935.1 hypothetical protein SAICODRAFT_166084 [Saitoella complicata NRRL Y-17804]
MPWQMPRRFLPTLRLFLLTSRRFLRIQIRLVNVLTTAFIIFVVTTGVTTIIVIITVVPRSKLFRILRMEVLECIGRQGVVHMRFVHLIDFWHQSLEDRPDQSNDAFLERPPPRLALENFPLTRDTVKQPTEPLHDANMGIHDATSFVGRIHPSFAD